MNEPSIIQLVLGSDNLPLSKHLYSEVFGFAGSGERLIYSRHNGEVMALGDWGGAMVAYMVGCQELMQLEFWSHTEPPQRPLPAGWQPNDIGFCRFGIAVPDFDGVLDRLDRLHVRPLTTPSRRRGRSRRVCFRDPALGIPVEIMEDAPDLPGRRERYHDLDPSIVYVAASVADLEESTAYFRDVVGLTQVDCELHVLEDEALWGLAGARRTTAILRGGTTFLELVAYERPAGRARPLDDGLNIQGFVTVAFGARDPAESGVIFHRVRRAGLTWTVSDPASFIGGNHVVEPVALHMKTLSVPHELEGQFGYAPAPARWWRPPAQSITGSPSAPSATQLQPSD